jgi:hypothetical protein
MIQVSNPAASPVPKFSNIVMTVGLINARIFALEDGDYVSASQGIYLKAAAENTDPVWINADNFGYPYGIQLSPGEGVFIPVTGSISNFYAVSSAAAQQLYTAVL